MEQTTLQEQIEKSIRESEIETIEFQREQADSNISDLLAKDRLKKNPIEFE